MIQVSGLYKTYGEQILFENASFVINARERIGLVGRNGSGKSTVLKMIMGEETPDKGTITYPKGYRIGKLSQHLQFTKATILEEACLGLPKEESDQTYRAEIVLSGLGFTEDDFLKPAAEFSGGFQIRINLARLLLSEPHLLLLDEPTNYLDIVSSRWLAETLRSWKNELIVITHDRSFMDSVTTHTMLIYRNSFRKVQGHTEKLYEAIALDEEVYEKTRLNEDKKRKEIEQFVNRFRAKASKASLVQSRIKALERMGVKEELSEESSLDFQFASKEFFGKTVGELNDITFGYQKNPPLIKNLTVRIGKGDRIGIIGKNGRGKSTLLRLICGELSPSSGTVSMSASTSLAYFGQTNIDRLHSHLTVEQEIAAAHPGMHRTKVRAICGTMMFDGDKALKKVSVLSGGEKSRVLLGKIIATPSNLLVLDEPTNHLDLESVEALKDALLSYEGSVLLVTHNEMLLRELCTRLIVFQGAEPFVLEGGYDYFLQKVGWDNEELAPSKRQPTEKKKLPPHSHGVDSAKTKAKLLKQLGKRIESLEQVVIKLEDEEKELQQLITAATAENNQKEIVSLSTRLFSVGEAIEKAFSGMDELTSELKRIESEEN